MGNFYKVYGPGPPIVLIVIWRSTTPTMVHVRLNQAEPNPNHHINFITALPTIPEQQEEARQLLRALAAQVRPVMKAHGFTVNSLEEVHTLLSVHILNVAYGATV